MGWFGRPQSVICLFIPVGLVALRENGGPVRVVAGGSARRWLVWLLDGGVVARMGAGCP
jgi:hypothetical protein